MLNRGDLDLNSVQNCTDSIKQRLKQTMLNQELVFMRQVYELHRVYRIQVAMMEDFKKKRMDSYNLHIGVMNSNSTSRNRHAECHMAEFTQFENFSSQHEWHKLPGFVQKPLDLHLSADEFISRSADHFLGKGILGGSLEESFKSTNTSPGQVFDLDDLKLSLSIGEDTGKRRFRRSWIGKKTRPSSSEIIDLEDPNLLFSINHTYLWQASCSAALNISSRHDQMSVRVSQFASAMMDTCNRTSWMTSSYQRPTPSDSGPNGHSTELLSADLLSKNQTTNTCKRDNLDLNMVKVEDTSCLSNDHSMVLNPPRSNLSCVSPTPVKKTNVNQCPETPNMPQQFDLNVDLATSYGDKISSKDLDSDSQEDLCSSKSNPKVESVGSSSKPSNGLSGEQHRRPSDSSESNIQCSIRKEPDMDEMLRKAAESLVQISLQTQEMASKELRNEEDDRPECSSDSYAEMVLKAKENDPDDYCVSSNAFVVDESENKESTYKLKRGTRMKDFQKDILPGLSILSRHEIREDINIMDGILRSREYKKMRAKFDYGGDWCRPSTRNKRAKVRCSRR